MTTINESGDTTEENGGCKKWFQKIWTELRKDKEDQHQIAQELLGKFQEERGFIDKQK